MQRNHFIIFLCFCAFMSCRNAPEKNFDPEIVRAEAREMLQNFQDDLREEGLIAEFKYLDSSYMFYWTPPGAESSLKYDSVAHIIMQNHKRFTTVDYKWDTLELYPLTSTICNFSGRVHGRLVDTAQNLQHVSIIESGTLIKRDDGWKFLSGQSSSQ